MRESKSAGAMLPSAGNRGNRHQAGRESLRTAGTLTLSSSEVDLKLPAFHSPHEARSVMNSSSRLVKDLATRISMHCPPAHNWETRRKDLQDSVRMTLVAGCDHRIPDQDMFRTCPVYEVRRLHRLSQNIAAAHMCTRTCSFSGATFH